MSKPTHNNLKTRLLDSDAEVTESSSSSSSPSSSSSSSRLNVDSNADFMFSSAPPPPPLVSDRLSTSSSLHLTISSPIGHYGESPPLSAFLINHVSDPDQRNSNSIQLIDENGFSLSSSGIVPIPLCTPPSMMSQRAVSTAARDAARQEQDKLKKGNEKQFEFSNTKHLGRRQLVIMMHKNWLLKRRHIMQFVCELITPIFMICIIVMGWSFSLDHIQTYPDAIYANNTGIIQDIADRIHPTYKPAPDPSQVCLVVPQVNDWELCLYKRDAEEFLQILYYDGPMPIPSLDDYLQLHEKLTLVNATEANLGLLQKLDDVTDHYLTNIIFKGKLSWVVPQGEKGKEVERFIHFLNATNPRLREVEMEIFDNEDAAVDDTINRRDIPADPNDPLNHNPYTWAVIMFNQFETLTGTMDYTIRMNYTTLPRTTSIKSQYVQGLDDSYKRYYFSGFLTLQGMIDEGITTWIEHGFSLDLVGIDELKKWKEAQDPNTLQPGAVDANANEREALKSELLATVHARSPLFQWASQLPDPFSSSFPSSSSLPFSLTPSLLGPIPTLPSGDVFGGRSVGIPFPTQHYTGNSLLHSSRSHYWFGNVYEYVISSISIDERDSRREGNPGERDDEDDGIVGLGICDESFLDRINTIYDRIICDDDINYNNLSSPYQFFSPLYSVLSLLDFIDYVFIPCFCLLFQSQTCRYTWTDSHFRYDHATICLLLP